MKPSGKGGILSIALALAFVLPAYSQLSIPANEWSPPSPPKLNPKQIAMLQWYHAAINTTSANALAFDGEFVWAAGSYFRRYSLDTGLEKLRGNSLLLPAPAGGMVFDGQSMWISSSANNTVSKIRVSRQFIWDGDNLFDGDKDYYRQAVHSALGSYPTAMAFDGTNVWIVNSGSNNVAKLRALDGQPMGLFPVGLSPKGIAFDGNSIWVTNSGSSSVTRLSGTGDLLGTFYVGAEPSGIAFDGTHMWVANTAASTVSKLRASDGALMQTINVGQRPTGVVFDGTYVWVTNFGSKTVSKLLAVDGSTVGTFSAGSAPAAILFDGTRIWVGSQ